MYSSIRRKQRNLRMRQPLVKSGRTFSQVSTTADCKQASHVGWRALEEVRMRLNIRIYGRILSFLRSDSLVKPWRTVGLLLVWWKLVRVSSFSLSLSLWESYHTHFTIEILDYIYVVI